MKNYIIKNRIKRIPSGMELNRRTYHMTSPIGLISKVYQAFDSTDAFAVIRIVSYIRIAQKEYADGNNMFVNISRQKMRDIAGDNYRKYLLWLETNDIIEINESYSTEQHYTKSYRYTSKSYDKPITVTKWQIDVLDDTHVAYESKVDSTVFTPEGKYDNELLYCLEHENMLFVPDPESIIDRLPDKMKSYASEWFYEINRGKCLPKPQSKSTRFYFNSILMSKDLRSYLKYDKNKSLELANYDIKTAYPSFTKLLAIYNNKNRTDVQSILILAYHLDSEDKKVLYDFFNAGDFYYLLSKDTKFDRESIKKEYNKYTNSNDVEYKKNHIFTKRLYEMGHSDMADYIINANNIWITLEEMETSILIDVCNNCIANGIPFIRQHDGFLTTKESIVYMNDALSNGYSSIFKFKCEALFPTY